MIHDIIDLIVGNVTTACGRTDHSPSVGGVAQTIRGDDNHHHLLYDLPLWEVGQSNLGFIIFSQCVYLFRNKPLSVST